MNNHSLFQENTGGYSRDVSAWATAKKLEFQYRSFKKAQLLVWMIIINYLKLLRTGFQAIAVVFSWIAIGA